jgi:ATP-dependent DNA ligase
MTVWIGDRMNGHKVETMFSRTAWARRRNGWSTRRAALAAGLSGNSCSTGLRRAWGPVIVSTVPKSPQPPRWIKPQLTRLVDEAPAGKDWVHEIKYDGYRMHARIDGAKIQLLTRTGLDWSHRYCRTIEAIQEEG